MFVQGSDSDQTIPLTPVSSFRPLDMVGEVMPVPTAQPVVTNQVTTQTVTNISADVTNPLVNSTNQDACDHPTDHEWVWF